MDGRGQRGGHEEVAVAVGDVRARRADEVEGAGDVHVKGLVPDTGVAVDQGHLRADARVRDRDVEPAEALDRRCHRVVHLRAVRHVAFEPRGVSASSSRLGEQLRLEADECHLRAALVEALGRKRADPSRAAGNQDALAFEIRHARTVAYLRTRVFTNC